MSVPRPQFTAPRRGRRGYDPDAVDSFVELVLARIDGEPGGESVTAQDLGIMVFREAPKGVHGYESAAVDDWLARMRPLVAEAETAARATATTAPPADSALAMSAPAHFADRFPRVSRAVNGFSVADVDALLDEISAALQAGAPVDTNHVARAVLRAEPGGYRQSVVADMLDLIVLALRAPA